MTDQPDLFLQDILLLAQRNAERFPDKFLSYLPHNLHVYHAFRREALAVWRKGYKHFGARTIIEVLRYNSAMRENSNEVWKLNDVWTPYLSRLFILENPQCEGLFELRKSKKVFTPSLET